MSDDDDEMPKKIFREEKKYHRPQKFRPFISIDSFFWRALNIYAADYQHSRNRKTLYK